MKADTASDGADQRERPHREEFPVAAMRLLTRLGAVFTVSMVIATAHADQVTGTVRSIDVPRSQITLLDASSNKQVTLPVDANTAVRDEDGNRLEFADLKVGQSVVVARREIAEQAGAKAMASQIVKDFLANFRFNLFSPLVLFFFMGFLVPILRVQFEFPHTVYQALTIYLLLAIGWQGGKEMAHLVSSPTTIVRIYGFIAVGFGTNFAIGILTYSLLKITTQLRRVNIATIAGYYGSDSAGTFVTCTGFLMTLQTAYDGFMPVTLAVMELPGCLVALYLVHRLALKGMDAMGNMPDEPGYDPAEETPRLDRVEDELETEGLDEQREHRVRKLGNPSARHSAISPALLHEVFLNPGIYLLFGGIIIGFVRGKQRVPVDRSFDFFFVRIFPGLLCLFLLEMGMTASRKLRDLSTAGLSFIIFGISAPVLFAMLGILVARSYAAVLQFPFELGTYVLFAVLCASASYIAVPAVQRLAIPEASPTLPLAASLGLTFSFNVTVGIPIYLEMAKTVLRIWPP